MAKESVNKNALIPPMGEPASSDSILDGRGAQFINCGPVINKQAGLDPIVTIEPRPFMEMNVAPPTSMNGDVRRIIPVIGASKTYTYFIVDDVLYSETYANLGTLGHDASYVGYCITETHLILLEGVNNTSFIHSVQLSDNALTTQALALDVIGDPVYLDGYIFIATKDRIYNSAINDPLSFDLANDYLVPEQFPDEIITIARHHNHIVAFSTESIEFFYDAGNQYGSPLQRNPAYTTEIGVPYYEAHTLGVPLVIALNDDLYFVGMNNSALITVNKLSGFKVTQVSSTYINQILNKKDVFTPDLSTLIENTRLHIINHVGKAVLMVSYTDNRVTPRRNYVYSDDTKSWSEWKWHLPSYVTNPDAGTSTSNDIHTTVPGSAFTASPPYNTGTVFYVHVKTVGSAVGHIEKGSFTEYKDVPNDEEMECVITTTQKNFGNMNYKRFNAAEVWGNYSDGPTSITLHTNKTSDYLGFVNRGTRLGAVLRSGAIRYNNLGRHKRLAFRVQINTKNHFQYKGLNISYEQGTV